MTTRADQPGADPTTAVAMRERAAPAERTERFDRNERVEALVRRLQAGDARAFDAFYKETFPTVYRMCFRLMGGSDEFEDVVQDVYLRVYRKIHLFEWRSQVSTWLYRICANTVTSRRRWSRVTQFFALMPGEDFATTLPELTDHRLPSDEAERSQFTKCIYKALETLSEKKRTVFILYELEERTAEEIAEILEIPLFTVYSRLRHARAEFKVAFDVLMTPQGAGGAKLATAGAGAQSESR